MITNPGNVLPIYDNLREQWRYRWGHAAYGVIAPVRTFIPFRLRVSGGSVLASWRIINVNTGESVDLLVNGLQCETVTFGDWTWYTWMAAGDLPMEGVTPFELPCGQYFFEFRTSRNVKYFSEVMNAEEIGGYERAALSSSCAGNEVSLSAFDTLRTAKTYESIQRYDGVQYVEVGSDTYTQPNATAGPSETYLFRRVVFTAGGSYLITYYRLDFDVADACGTYVLQEYQQENRFTHAERALITFQHKPDEGMGSGYTQRIYLDAFMDFPEVTTENETTIDGFGRVRVLSSNVKERAAFEFSGLADHHAHVLSLLGAAESATINYHELPGIDGMEEIEFSYRVAEDGYYSTGRLAYLKRQVFLPGCTPSIPFELCG